MRASRASVLYGGRGADGTARLLVMNPTGTAFGATVAADPGDLG